MEPWLVAIAIGAIAYLYAAVGHAGASGYIAVLTLAAWEPQVIKPTALVLNLLVASLGVWQFLRQGHFSWGLFWPLALMAVPMAFLGGYLNLPAAVFQLLIGLVLWGSALRFLWVAKSDESLGPPPWYVGLPTGAGLGFLAGLTGTGGGVFLTPLVLWMRWATTKQTAGVSVLFILLNSAAGLAGNFSSTQHFPTLAVGLAVAAAGGGLLGAYCGSTRFSAVSIKRLLAVVLLIAGGKLILTALS